MRSLVISIVICVMITACNKHTGAEVHTHPIPKYVVSTILLPVSAESAREHILSGFEVGHERDDPFYRANGFKNEDDWEMLIAESKENAIFGDEFFRDPKNANDLYLHSMGAEFLSSFYFTSDGPLYYSATFAVSIDPVDMSHCKITVRSIDSHIFNGAEFNGHAMGYVPISVPVASSPTEEYRVLVYAAHLNGVNINPL